jgi:hypothetical protein
MPELIRGKSNRGRKVVVYGGPGLGKTTLASQAEGAIFIPTEDGLSEIDCAHYPVATTIGEWEANLAHAAKSEVPIGQINVDSGDWLERLIHHKLCADDSVSDITAFGKGYGRGYKASLSYLESILRKMEFFTRRGTNVCFLCHDKIIQVDDPVHGTYSQSTLRMHEFTRDCLIEWADEVLYLCPKIAVDKETERASGGTVRVLKTTFNPAYRAKSRAKMPPEIVVPAPDKGNGWAEYWKYITEKNDG